MSLVIVTPPLSESSQRTWRRTQRSWISSPLVMTLRGAHVVHNNCEETVKELERRLRTRIGSKLSLRPPDGPVATGSPWLSPAHSINASRQLKHDEAFGARGTADSVHLTADRSLSSVRSFEPPRPAQRARETCERPARGSRWGIALGSRQAPR